MQLILNFYSNILAKRQKNTHTKYDKFPLLKTACSVNILVQINFRSKQPDKSETATIKAFWFSSSYSLRLFENVNIQIDGLICLMLKQQHSKAIQKYFEFHFNFQNYSVWHVMQIICILEHIQCNTIAKERSSNHTQTQIYYRVLLPFSISFMPAKQCVMTVKKNVNRI